jgi:nitronate monooxygenase
MDDVTYTPAISGIPANFLNASLVACGLDPSNLPEKTNVDIAEELNHETKAWKDVWSAGHGTGAIHDVVSTETLIARLTHELDAAQLEILARRVPFSKPTAG